MAYFLKKRRPESLSHVSDGNHSGARTPVTPGVRMPGVSPSAPNSSPAARSYRSAIRPHTNGDLPYSGVSGGYTAYASANGGARQKSGSKRDGYDARHGSAQGGGDAVPDANGSDGDSYDPGGFEDAYNRIVAILNSYGIPMEFPTYDELYAQLEALLRPSVDAAIDKRQRYGESMLAELDADAYSRGMGGSSYLSGMKNREYDSIASDIASLEAGYTSDIANYLYNATNELSKLQAQFAEMFLQNELNRQAARENASAGGSGHGSGGSGSSGSPGKSGNDQSDKGNAGSSYEDYTSYIEYLSEEDRYKLFHSNDEYWSSIRSQMTEALSDEDYRRLRQIYDTGGNHGSSGGHGGSGDNGGGHSGGENLWQSILY